jgi:hypothetical protein
LSELYDRCLAAGVDATAVAPLLVPSIHFPGKFVVNPEELQALTGLARLAGAERCVETGSYSGSSAGAFLQVCRDVWSIDTNDLLFDEGFAQFYGRPHGPGWNLPLESRHRINFVWGMGREKLKLLVSDRRVTLFFHDSDHSYANVLDELTEAYQAGARAIAAHDLHVDETRGAWQAWIERCGITRAEIAPTGLGLGLWLSPGYYDQPSDTAKRKKTSAA